MYHDRHLRKLSTAIATGYSVVDIITTTDHVHGEMNIIKNPGCDLTMTVLVVGNKRMVGCVKREEDY